MLRISKMYTTVTVLISICEDSVITFLTFCELFCTEYSFSIIVIMHFLLCILYLDLQLCLYGAGLWLFVMLEYRFASPCCTLWSEVAVFYNLIAFRPEYRTKNYSPQLNLYYIVLQVMYIVWNILNIWQV